jgi:hypothetical protein
MSKTKPKTRSHAFTIGIDRKTGKPVKLMVPCRNGRPAGGVARALYRSPAQNAAEARFVDQMGRYGMLASRTLTAGKAGAPAQ